MDTIQKIKEFVKEECEKPTSKYGHELFENHFVPMIKHAEELVDQYGGDREVILIAAWLHDIGSVVYGRKDHNITGAKIAEDKLREFNYPQEKIDLIKKCIFNHRGSMQNHRETTEEKIVAEADVISNFDNIPGIFNAALVFENRTQKEAKEAVRTKLQNKWNQLHFESSKKLMEPRYKAAMLLFS